MSLQGTFDTLSVTELFGLLATAAKTGALRLEASDHEASVFVSGGRCSAVESAEAREPAGSDVELAGRLVDVGFAFARHPGGSFRFSDSELVAYDTGVTTPFEPTIAEIASQLDQWREIEATIPSLDVRVRLAPVLRDEEIVVTAGEWTLLVAIEGTPTVRELIARRQQPMLQVCRDLKELVDRGALEVGAEVAPSATVNDAVSDAVPVVTNGNAPGLAVPHAHSLEPVAPFAPEAYEPDTDVADTDVAATAAVAELRAVSNGAEESVDLTDFADIAAAATAGPDPLESLESLAEDESEAAAEADAVAAGIVSRMTIGGRPSADVPAVANGADSRPEDAVDAADPGDAAQDRGALLRLFSALKDS